MGHTWVLSVPNGPHVRPMNLAVRDELILPVVCEQPAVPGCRPLHLMAPIVWVYYFPRSVVRGLGSCPNELELDVARANQSHSPYWYIGILTHWDRDQIDAISQTPFSNVLPRISLKFVPTVRINNIPALVQIMAWCRPGDKPLSEPMMVRLPTHICVTRPQCVNYTSWKNICSNSV